jgi:anti-anti-sigma factor
VGLQASVTPSDDGPVIRLAGELDMSTVDVLRTTVQAELGEDIGRVTLDLSELAFCDSLGLGTLLVLSRTARSHQTLLVLRNPGPYFVRMVVVAGVRDAFTFARS